MWSSQSCSCRNFSLFNWKLCFALARTFNWIISEMIFPLAQVVNTTERPPFLNVELLSPFNQLNMAEHHPPNKSLLPIPETSSITPKTYTSPDRTFSYFNFWSFHRGVCSLTNSTPQASAVVAVIGTGVAAEYAKGYITYVRLRSRPFHTSFSIRSGRARQSAACRDSCQQGSRQSRQLPVTACQCPSQRFKCHDCSNPMGKNNNITIALLEKVNVTPWGRSPIRKSECNPVRAG